MTGAISELISVEKSTLLILILLLILTAYHWGRSTSTSQAIHEAQPHPHSLPAFHGWFTALWCGIPPLLLIVLWTACEGTVTDAMTLNSLPREMTSVDAQHIELLLHDIRSYVTGASSDATETWMQAAAERYRRYVQISDWLVTGLTTMIALLGAVHAHRQIRPDLKARNKVEQVLSWFLIACATVAVITTIGIILSVLIESIRFFQKIPLLDFLFGLKWSPQIAIRADQMGASGAFGSVPLITGTLLIAFIAMTVAVPVGLLSAIYLSEYAGTGFRAICKPLLEILAGIPTVVYGFFAALVVAPFIRELGTSIDLDVASESALAAGLVMGIMIIPFVSSLSDDFINAVPQSLRDGAYALGATPSETIRQVILPAALPGVVGGILLAVSRAIGETMIVVMAAGLNANLTLNPLQAVTTVTAQIVTLLVGDQEFDSPKTLAAFALGLVLFLQTLALNILALRIVRKYREQYE